MPENLLGILKLCLLALVYLFFLRVLWAVYAEVRGPLPARSPRGAPRPPGPTAAPLATSTNRRGKVPRKAVVSKLTVAEPIGLKGRMFPVSHEVTLGRAAGCGIALQEDAYASQLHARVFQRDGRTFVEDLGSTNGTYLNGARVTGAVPLARGDALQVGATVMEVG
jgi:hypothetical protein